MKKVFYLFTVLLTALLFSCKMGDAALTEYYVVHLQQNIEDDGYTEFERETLNGTTGDFTQATAKSYTGFIVQPFVQEQITANAEIEIKYDRIPVTFTLNLAGGSGETSVTKKYGTPVTKETLPDPTNEGATFSFWAPELPETFKENGTYTANWNYTSYKVKYLFQNIEDDEYSELPDYTEKTYYGKIGEKIAIKPETFEAFEAKEMDAVELTQEGQIITVYFDRKVITVFIDLDGGKGISYVSGKSGAELTANMFGTLSKTGYSYSGFDRELPETFNVTDNNKVIAKVLWVAGGDARYGIKFYKQSKYSDEDVYYEAPELKTKAVGKTGELTKVEYNEKTNQYIINGAAVDIKGFHPVAEDSEYALKNKEILGNETTVVSIYLDRNVSTYYFDYNGGYAVGEEIKFVTGRYEEVVDTPVLARKGYTRSLELWTNEDNPIYFPTESTEKTYTAKWEPNHYTVKYDDNCPADTMPVTKNADPVNDFIYDEEKATSDTGWITREYYTFTGVNTKADGTGVQYNPGDPIYNLTDVADGEVTLYCQWKPYNAPALDKFEAKITIDNSKDYFGEPGLNYLQIEYTLPASYTKTDTDNWFDENCYFSLYINDEVIQEPIKIPNGTSKTIRMLYDFESSKKYTITGCIIYSNTKNNKTVYLPAENKSEAVVYSPLLEPSIQFTACTADSIVLDITPPASEEGFEVAKIEYWAEDSFSSQRNPILDIKDKVEPGKTSRIEITDLREDTLYRFAYYFKDKHNHGTGYITPYQNYYYHKQCFTAKNLAPGTAKVGQIYYDDGTWSYIYDSSKIPVGIILLVDNSGKPTRIFAYDGQDELYWKDAKTKCEDYESKSTKEQFKKGKWTMACKDDFGSISKSQDDYSTKYKIDAAVQTIPGYGSFNLRTSQWVSNYEEYYYYIVRPSSSLTRSSDKYYAVPVTSVGN